MIENWVGDVTLSDILITNANSSFGPDALYIGTTGKVTLTRVDVDTNVEVGAYITNPNGSTPKDVVITNSTFSNNAGGNGLDVGSFGTITLSNVVAENNGTFGVFYGGGAILDNVSSFAKDVMVSNSTFSDNNGVGLGVNSSGKITLTNVSVNGSMSADGAVLTNYNGTKDVVISNSTFLDNGEFGNGKGLFVGTRGNITITNITATGNTEWGAELDNCDFDSGGDDPGDDPSDDTCGNSVAKNVTLLGTNIFGDNVGGGLAVYSLGAININNLISNSNGGWGALLLNHKALTNQPVTLTKYSEFKFNGSGGDGAGGLQIVSRGTVTLYNITATNNINDLEDDGGTGLKVDNTFSTAGSNVTLIGTNTFTNNFLHGVDIISKGAITASNVTASGNGTGVAGGYGALLSNSESLSPKGVTLSGTNQFNGNYSGGLEIESIGAVSLSNVSANDNSNGSGVIIQNPDYGNPAIQQNVTILGVNSFSGNNGYGLSIESSGTVTIYKITASENSPSSGLFIDNRYGMLPRNVSILGYGTVGNNGNRGAEIYSNGSISIANLTANGNSVGVELINDSVSTIQGNVTLSGVTSTNDNPGGFGLYIRSYGTVTVSKLTASGNGTFGADISNSGGLVAKNVTISGYATTNSNSLGSGLQVLSDGIISVANITANDNDAYGVYLDNSSAATPKVVTISGTNSMEGNGFNGLFVLSRGAITVSNVTASFNGYISSTHLNDDGHGVYLDNYSFGVDTSPQNVTLNGYVNVEENFTSGLVVHTYGTIVVNNIFAAGNGWLMDTFAAYGGYGAILDNTHGTLVRPVTLKGTNEVYGNFSGGLLVNSFGAIAANNLYANFNGDSGVGSGAILQNEVNPAVPQNVTLTGYANFELNAGDGLLVNTYGAITISNLFAGGNSNYGVILNNGGGFLAKSVALKGTNGFTDNGQAGLSVSSLGAITVSNIYAEGNTGNGAELANDNLFALPITLTGTNTFLDNTIGLQASSLGAIKINNLTASLNDTGAWLSNYVSGSTSAIVTLTGSQVFENNDVTGLRVDSPKVVSISNVTSISNGGNGVMVDNTSNGAGLPADVKITGTNTFSDNGYSGLVILTYGAVTLNNLTAEDNGWLGGFSVGDPTERGFGVLVDGCRAGSFELQNCSATISKNVTISGTNTFNGNAQTGLLVQSLGLIKANALSASENQEAGVQLLNNWDQALPLGVTLTGTNSFIDNEFQGLVIYSHRTITLSNVTANLNGDGASINTLCNSALLTCVANVLMTGTNTFNENGDFGAGVGIGLDVYSVGSISINNLTANGNGETGADLTNNSPSIGTPFIKLTGVNNFIGNKYYGLRFDSTGAVTLLKITADGNLLGDGVNGYSDGAITITCGSMTNNGLAGLSLTSLSTITLKGVFLLGNGDNSYPVGATIVRSC